MTWKKKFASIFASYKNSPFIAWPFYFNNLLAEHIVAVLFTDMVLYNKVQVLKTLQDEADQMIKYSSDDSVFHMNEKIKKASINLLKKLTYM